MQCWGLLFGTAALHAGALGPPPPPPPQAALQFARPLCCLLNSVLEDEQSPDERPHLIEHLLLQAWPQAWQQRRGQAASRCCASGRRTSLRARVCQTCPAQRAPTKGDVQASRHRAPPPVLPPHQIRHRIQTPAAAARWRARTGCRAAGTRCRMPGPPWRRKHQGCAWGVRIRQRVGGCPHGNAEQVVRQQACTP